jgi:hypothetical protein
MQNTCRLFIANGPIVNEKPEYDSFGAGQYMADFLASRMYDKHLNLRQCAIVAAYILFQAKEHVDGCGGESHIAVLRKNGVSGVAGYRNIAAWTELLKLSDYQIGSVLIDSPNVEMEDQEFTEKSKNLIEVIDELRKDKAAELRENQRMMAAFLGGNREGEDFFGLPLPPSS